MTDGSGWGGVTFNTVKEAQEAINACDGMKVQGKRIGCRMATAQDLSWFAKSKPKKSKQAPQSADFSEDQLRAVMDGRDPVPEPMDTE